MLAFPNECTSGQFLAAVSECSMHLTEARIIGGKRLERLSASAIASVILLLTACDESNGASPGQAWVATPTLPMAGGRAVRVVNPLSTAAEVMWMERSACTATILPGPTLVNVPAPQGCTYCM